ncbi:hypothetical protein K488DRAFT_81947 [Vararia minispora EC-137]|uniref:Uncharacterized protein n=1 Tax=Vararia minispora EC-137 TaxID=1314806 RepID=A0ACB8QYU6_9AGAM|nr:hypothetical protein K488DRAFT_81947 [Vararia minispora EC-137]
MAPMPVSASVPAVVPSDSSLIPRREFLKHTRTPSSFSILTLAGSCQIRLYSFPPPVAAAVRLLLDRTRVVIGHKEDVLHNYVEFAVDGKPWANPKSLPSEKLLLDILAVLLHQGFEFRSTFDFGREQDDRIIVAFSKPTTPINHTPTTSPPSSPVLQSQPFRTSQVSSSAAHPARLVKHPFAISFPSATLLRVISPPLASTPAILQSVRGSWPRGVVSERKIGPDSYEFKLKGYKWFQEDTFASDSLGYVLNLLASLDSHGFTLIASLVITNRSRVKDLWIFTGYTDPAALESPPSSTPSESRSELKPSHLTERRSEDVPREVLSPPGNTESGHPRGHGRSATVGGKISPDSSSPSKATLLRKPAPRAQLPVSVVSSIGGEDGNASSGPIPHRRSDELIHAPLQSAAESAVDMTGVGTRQWQPPSGPATPSAHPDVPSPAVFYQTSVPDHNNPYLPSHPDLLGDGSPKLDQQQALPAQDTPDFPAAASLLPPQPSFLAVTPSAGNTPPLLSPEIFRDSAFSSGSVLSSEIPITWTGPVEGPLAPDSDPRAKTPKTPVLPGGWTSPADEVPPEVVKGEATNEHGDLDFRPRPQDMTPQRQELHAASAFSVTQPSPSATRKSEPVVLEQGPHESPASVPPVPSSSTPLRPPPRDRTDSPASPSPAGDGGGGGEGWVIVNVTGTPVAAPPPSTPSKPSTRPPGDARAHPYDSRTPPQNLGGSQHHVESPQASLTAAAHQIVEGRNLKPPVADGGSSDNAATRNPHHDQRSQTEAHVRVKTVTVVEPLGGNKQPPSSPLRRIFSQSKSTGKPGAKGGVSKAKSFEQEENERARFNSMDSAALKPKVGLRERWRRRGVPEVTTKTDRRMSVD